LTVCSALFVADMSCSICNWFSSDALSCLFARRRFSQRETVIGRDRETEKERGEEKRKRETEKKKKRKREREKEKKKQKVRK
jgi:hypothetical protein